jgi:hypothetical protein
MGTKALWCGGLILAAVAFAAEPIPCSLDVASEGTDVLLSVPSDGNVDVNLVCSSAKTTPGTLELVLSAFTGDEGSFAVGLLPAQAEAGTKPQQPLRVTAPRTMLIPLRLTASSLPLTGKYTGRLTMVAEGRDPVIRKIVLTREAQRGTLVISPQPVNLTVARPFLFWKPMQETTFSVALREKSGKVRLEGITARLESVAKAPEGGFGLERNASFTFNGAAAERIEETPEAGSGRPARDIPAGSQAVVAATLKNLKAGEYDAVLHFQAANSNDDDAQKLTLTVQARDPWGWALMVLALALVISFATTKLLDSHRRRAVLLMRIRELRAKGIESEPHSVPVVWARSVLRQTEKLSRRFLLTSPDRIDARIENLEPALDLLSRISGLRSKLKEARLDPWINRRTAAKLDHIVGSMGAFTPNEAKRAEIGKGLDELEEWLVPSKREECYWEDLSKAIDAQLRDTDLDAVQDADAKTIMQGFANSLDLALKTTPAGLKAKFEAEKQYAALKILWERHAESHELELAVLRWNETGDIHKLFDLADDQTWERMHRAEAGLEIDMPSTDPANAAEAFDVLHFEVKTADPLVQKAYLFQHGVEYHWRFELSRRRWWEWPTWLVLEPRSAEPRIVQYVPRSAKLKASVRAVPAWRRESTTGAEAKAELALTADRESLIRSSSDFAGYKKFQTAEIISWLLAAGLALTTGMATFYFKSGAFGSVQDYLTMFAWGTSIDQAKTIFQSAQDASKAPEKKS